VQLNFCLARIHDLLLHLVDLLPEVLLLAVLTSFCEACRQVLLFAQFLGAIHFTQLQQVDSQLFPQTLQQLYLQLRWEVDPSNPSHNFSGVELLEFLTVLSEKLPTHQ